MAHTTMLKERPASARQRFKVLATALVAGFALAGAGGTAAEGRGQLGQSVAPTAIEVNLASLPMATEASVTHTPPRPRTGLSAEEYRRSKADAAANRYSANAEALATAAKGPPPTDLRGQLTPNANRVFTGLQQVGTIRPSDMALAVGKNQLVQVVNSQIQVLNNDTGAVRPGFPKALGGAGGFFTGASTDIGDPRAFYDPGADRFVVVADDFTNGQMWLAASQTSDATGGWWVYSFAPWGAASCRVSGMACPDFPMIGVSEDTILLSLNLFPAAGGVSNWVLLLPKAIIYAGGGFGYNFWSNLSFGGILVDTVQPTTQLRSERTRTSFAINTRNINFGGTQCRTGCNGLIVWAFSNNLQAAGSPGPVLTAVSVPTATTYFFPADANQPGSPNSVDTLDVRISASPTFHNGLISSALTTNGPDAHAHVLWTQVRPFLNDGSAACVGAFANMCAQVTGAEIVNEDCFFCAGQGAAGSSYVGAVQPNDAGDLTMVYTYSDNNTFPESAYASRRVTQAKNTLHDAGIVLCGNASLWTGYRWGDYSATSGFPKSSQQPFVYFSSMNTTAGGHWGGCIGRNGFANNVNP